MKFRDSYYSGQERKLAIRKFILEYRADRGIVPSHREICRGVGLSSTSNVNRYLKQMAAEGLILKYIPGVARGIVI
jgi:repressor LexA